MAQKLSDDQNAVEFSHKQYFRPEKRAKVL